MVSEERLKLYLDDIHIYKFYFGDFTLRHKYNSPLRDDPKPSFQIKVSKTGNLYWKDYGMEEQKGFDAISFIMHLFDLKERKDAVKRIWSDILDSDEPIPHIRLKPDVNSIPYSYYYEELKDWELLYWSNLGISEDILKFFNVKSLIGMYRTDKVIWKSVRENPTYIYLFSKPKSFKAYRPLDSRGDKFRGQNNGDILEGYDQLPDKGEYLIITKSLKDVMVLRRCGVVSCSPTSENSFRTLLSYKEELDSRFKKVYVMFDNDEPGIKAAKFLSKETGWEVINFPKEYSKDPSDLVMKDRSYKRLNVFLSDYSLKRYYI